MYVPMNEGSQLDLPSGPFPRPFHITMALFQQHQIIKMKRCRSICVNTGFFSKKIFLHVNGTYRLKNHVCMIAEKENCLGLSLSVTTAQFYFYSIVCLRCSWVTTIKYSQFGQSSQQHSHLIEYLPNRVAAVILLSFQSQKCYQVDYFFFKMPFFTKV